MIVDIKFSENFIFSTKSDSISGTTCTEFGNYLSSWVFSNTRVATRTLFPQYYATHPPFRIFQNYVDSTN